MKLNNSIITGIILITLCGVILIILFDYLLYIEFFYNWNLPNLNYLITSLGFILSIVTIYLLYKNYTLQTEEFKKITEANAKANDIQLILYEKQSIDIQFKKLSDEFELDDVFLRKFYLSLSYLFDSKIKTDYSKFLKRLNAIDVNKLFELIILLINMNTQIYILEKTISNKKRLRLLFSNFDPLLIGFLNNIQNEFSFTGAKQAINNNYTNSKTIEELTEKITLLNNIKEESENLNKIIIYQPKKEI